ncbi:MAG TPA: hypothetical protein VEU32_22100 [Burkholderiales bacterium]|nr:hypothetical protein [Burkholderiales bacterium]
MQVRFALLAVLLAAGCAAQPEQQTAASATPASAAAAVPEKHQARDYRTGSRLPSLDDDRGPGAVSGQSKQDYMDDANSRTAPLRSN